MKQQDAKTRFIRALLALIGTALILEAIWLGARGIINVGIAVPALFGIALVTVAAWWTPIARWRAGKRWREWLWRLSWLGGIAWLASVGVFFWYVQHAASEPLPTQAPAAIVVLGSGSPNCRPSAILESRLEEAVRQAQRWPQAPLVVAGGIEFRARCSEAQVMANYLADSGVPAQRVWKEERSTSTEENLLFAKDLLASHNIDQSAPMLLVTSDFHLIRAEGIARKAGFSRMTGVAAPTPRYVRYNAWLREYFATLSSWALGEF